ncbi:MAG: zinc finger domain-containing protein [Methanobrevibacter sp.]|nr:zinc finger domain-containing protein [Methanobrevibacter sp.]
MKKVECKSCKQEIPLIDTYVKFTCPECDETIVRCEKCRTFGHTYICECGFEGP